MVQEFFLMLNTYVPYDPANPLLDIHPRVMATYVHRMFCIQMFITTLSLIAPNWKNSNVHD